MENYIELLELADIFNASRLEAKEIRFINKNKKEVDENKIKQLLDSVKYPNLAVKLFKGAK